MNSHNPFDVCQPWGGSYPGCNQSNDPLVDKLIGNAYHVVRTVYCNLGNLKLIYDFLTTYGMVLAVESETELKAMPITAKFIRIYGKTPAGDRQVTDYLYVEGDRTGVIPNDATATGSWVKVATSGTGGDGESAKDGGYIPWVYNQGSAIGGETSIIIPAETVGVPFIINNGYMQYVGYDFTFDVATLTLTFAQPLEPGDFIVVLRTGVPASPDDPNISNWVTINWLYNHGAAVGGEQVIAIPYTFQDVPAVYKNGDRYYKGLIDKSYTIDAANKRIILTEPLTTNDRVIVQLGGEQKVLEVADHTLEEVARSANVKNSEVILSTDTTTVLNNKTVLFDVTAQKSYSLPTLPVNVYIVSVSNDQLTYSPGNVVVELLPLQTPGQVLKQDLANPAIGDSSIGVRKSFLDAISRTQDSVNDDFLCYTDFGIVADGVTDNTANLIKAFAAASVSGKELRLPKGVIGVQPDALKIGNGSLSQSSTWNGITIRGTGFTPYTRGGTVIKALSAGDFLLKIDGLIEGITFTDLQFDCAGIVKDGIVTTTAVVHNWDGFGVYDWIRHGIEFKNRTAPTGGVTWSRTNSFKRFFITTTMNEDYSSGLHLSGAVESGVAPGPADMHNSIFELGTIQMNRRPTANACQAIFLGFTDSNQFREIDTIMIGSGFGYGITFSDQDNPGLPYPQNCLFIGCSLGGDAPRVIGSPGNNYLFHHAMKDGEGLPSNTSFIRGMTDDGLFFGPHKFEQITGEVLLNGATSNERTVRFTTPDGTNQAKIVHNSSLGLEVQVWNGTSFVTSARYLPNGQIYMNFDSIGFKQIDAGAVDSAGSGFRYVRIAN